jgi:serine/threonine protein kinase HipA of HipAB toxin-antitoxin module
LEGIRENTMKRFWDMFIIDFLIGNHDRNNTNWGVLVNDYNIIGLAPVYDNGWAFLDKSSECQFESKLNDKNLLLGVAYKGFRCVY